MKKSELKEIIKPIVKECVEESIKQIVIESGLLASVINEVIKGTLPLLVEGYSNKEPETQKTHQQISQPAQPKKTPQNSQLMEQLKREKEALSNEFKQQSRALENTLSLKVGGVDVFSQTKPAPAENTSEVANPLGGVSPSDPGVDISRLLGNKKFNIT